MPLLKSDPIVIVGAGAFGLSTALRLLEARFINITVLEKDDTLPSRFSAANDLNKIIRAEYEDPFYTELTLEAIRAWQTPLFAPHFHQTGFLHCVSGSAPERAAATLARFHDSAKRDPWIEKHVVPIEGPEDIRQHTWQYNDGPLTGWRGYLNRLGGYAHSANALLGVYRFLRERGVKFYTGDRGAVTEIIYNEPSNPATPRKSTGARTKTGDFPAKLVIVAAGAAAARLVPECGQHVVAKSWSVAHVQLTDDEASALRGVPVTYARDLGFFFEPDLKTNLLKLCPMGGGYVNTDPETGVSHAPEVPGENSFMPPHDQRQVRRLLAQTLPALADRPLIKQSLCWFADTNDSDFIIDYVPNTDSTVLLMSGDSGHGFKMFPIVGNWVRDMLLATDGKQPISKFRWKAPVSTEGKDWGGAVSWRLGATKELKDLTNPKSSKL
ncbi:hypothetical protein D7B24_004141 [Verticillium nonalfalfae]|uniref:FAD dependent oxidoreductase domain-containing protein n=1 Tax=Verticillium nonalfalfae TaxID=1051616 RepID=A0A3M9YE16_9PEZI|nr:uncharacterized protein D7B24_004141 [Verticillium nonalfalfae]RNJ58777.1 hypothetical protein D7B24_004141 [Verticillium nonalfalfae]